MAGPPSTASQLPYPGPAPTGPGVDVLERWVRSRQDELASRACASIYDEVPVYAASADRTLRTEVEAHCRQVYSAFLGAVHERRDPLRGDFPWTGRYAMRRVDLGITLPDFMQAFRIGQMVLWDGILEGVGEHPGVSDSALALVRQVMLTIEVGSTAAAEAYLEAQRFAVADHARLARDLLEDLVTGRIPTVRARREMLADVGLTEDIELVVAVGSYAVPGDDGGDQAGRAMLRTALNNPGRGLTVARHDEVVSVLPVDAGIRGGTADAEERVLTRLRAGVASLAGHGVFPCVGVSTVRTGLASVAEAYEEARLALRSLRGRTGVQSLGAMSSLDYLVQTHDRTAQRLVRPEVRAFVQEDLASGGTFVATLRAYVACDLNAKLAAVQLHVHANTVYYRLERISERTGCDVRRVESIIDLLIAVSIVAG